MDRMEQKYGDFFPLQRIEKWQIEGKELPKNITFFRNNRSAKQILAEAKVWKGIVRNDADQYAYQLDLLGGESCEVFSECQG
jgi:hypothetical protein